MLALGGYWAAAVLLVTGFCIVNCTADHGADAGAKYGKKQRK
jgi:hypothetical protein